MNNIADIHLFSNFTMSDMMIETIRKIKMNLLIEVPKSDENRRFAKYWIMENVFLVDEA